MNGDRPSLRAVVFDWAGTIQDRGSTAPVRALVEVFATRNIVVTPAEARAGMGRHKRDHLLELIASPGVSAQWRQRHGHGPSEADVDDLYDAFLPLQADAIRECGALIDGTVEAVAAIRARGIAIGTTSGYPRSLLDVAIAAAREQGFEADVTVAADEVPAARPEPWMLLHALEELRVYPPAAVLKVGDALVDVDEGRNAGTWTVGVAATGAIAGLDDAEAPSDGPLAADTAKRVVAARQALRDRGADLVVDSVADVPGALDDLEARLTRGERPR
jgi:phosphonoacetaldehyde hydrolase